MSDIEKCSLQKILFSCIFFFPCSSSFLVSLPEVSGGTAIPKTDIHELTSQSSIYVSSDGVDRSKMNEIQITTGTNMQAVVVR